MDQRSGLREFLMTRRGKISPEQAKLPAYGGNRRVEGLRREEVAMLAGVSADYYTKLERGSIGSVSDGVLDAVARALQLTPAERDHLFHLAGSTGAGRPAQTRSFTRTVRPALLRVLDSMVDSPAFIRTNSRDMLAANALGRAVYAPLYDRDTPECPNTARFVFRDPAAREFFLDWSEVAVGTVAALRGELGRTPYDVDLTDLIDELNLHSMEFQALWRAHDVRYHNTGFKGIHHPLVGDMHLTFESMELPADPGQTLMVYGTEPHSPSADALRLLASWSADPVGRSASSSRDNTLPS